MHYTCVVRHQQEVIMGLHKDYEDKIFSDYSYDEDVSDLDHKKKIKRLLEEKLERKRLKDEFKDDFDELNGEFDWDDLDK